MGGYKEMCFKSESHFDATCTGTMSCRTFCKNVLNKSDDL